MALNPIVFTEKVVRSFLRYQLTAHPFADARLLLTGAFVESFYGRLQAQGPTLGFIQAWLDHRLSEQGTSAAQLLENATRAAAADHTSIANSVGSLRFISSFDWGTFVEESSLAEHMLRADPAWAAAPQQRRRGRGGG